MFRAAWTKPPEFLILTEFLAGGDLGDRIYSEHLRRDTTDVSRLKWAMQIAMGLSELHNQGTPLVHRDLKPANWYARRRCCSSFAPFLICHCSRSLSLSICSLLDDRDDVKICDF